jgi:hypothetical protein
MLVTADPIAEIDAVLSTAVVERQRARIVGDSAAAARLTIWIDHLLDQRFAFHLTSCDRPVRP